MFKRSLGFIHFIETNNTGIVERFGRYVRTMTPGLNLTIPFIEKTRIANNRLQQETFVTQGKTRDNVFVDLEVAVQFEVEAENSVNAYYSLNNPRSQIDAYIQDQIRDTVPKFPLDDLFESKDQVCKSIANTVAKKMEQRGYTIQNTLVTAIEPDPAVKAAMNKINASERLKIAAANEAEAEYIKEVKKAEARSKAKELQGIGLGKQRLAILNSYKQGIEDLKSTGISPEASAQYALETLHYDSMVDVSKNSETKTIYLNQEPPKVFDLKKDVMEGVLKATN